MHRVLVRWAVLLVLLVPLTGQAVTRYVAQSGGSDSNTCTQAQTEGTAKATVNAAVACSTTCDVIKVNTGVYNEYLGNSTATIGGGYTRNPIPSGTASTCKTSIQENTGHTAVFRPSAAVSNAASIVLFTNTSTIVHDIEIIGFDFDGILCSPLASGPSGNCTGVFIGAGANNITIQGNNFYNMHQTGGNAGGGGGAIGLFAWPNLVPAHHIEILDNMIFNIGFDRWTHGIYINTHSNTVRGNGIWNISGAPIHLYYGGTSTGPAGMMHDNIIERNFMHHNALSRTGAVQQSVGAVVLGGINNRIRNNIIRDVIGHAMWFGWTSGGGQGNWFDNNTVCGATGSGIRIEGDTSGTVLRNNILRGTLGLSNSGSSTTNAASNLYDATNPLFVNPCTDVHLLTGSPAITGGDDLSAHFTTDFAGVTRASWGRGAYIGAATTPVVLVYSTPPTSAVAAAAIAPAIVVCAQVTSVTQTGFANNITLTLSTGTGVLSGGTATAPVSGCATFASAAIDTAGTKQITASATGAASVVSADVVITAEPPANPTFLMQYRQ